MMSDSQRTIMIDGREYELSLLSQAAKMQVTNVRAVDEELRRIEQKLAIYKTARAAYAKALKGELDRIENHASGEVAAETKVN